MPPLKTKQQTKPTLVNRGPAGLLTKLPKNGVATPAPVDKAARTVAVARHQIAPDLQQFSVPIDSVNLDPENARLHPERNLEAIKESLQTYGQVKLLVARKNNRIVVAGNGTLEAARLLGWKEIAVHFTEMNDTEAAGFGIADNRTAELAKWDFEVVQRLDKLLQEAGHPSIGWSVDELEVLRMAEWSPPPLTSHLFEQAPSTKMALEFTPDEHAQVQEALTLIKSTHGGTGPNALTDNAALALICQSWLSIMRGNDAQVA